MAAEDLQHLRMLAKTFPADLGLNTAPAAEPRQQEEALDGADCKIVNGQKFYNFDQLVQALVGSADPVCVLECTEEEEDQDGCEEEEKRRGVKQKIVKMLASMPRMAFAIQGRDHRQSLAPDASYACQR